MANVFDVAKFVIERKGVDGKMSTMKLQKLCYYAQVWSLVWDDAPLFDEEFEAWANGPVCRELYNRTRGSYYATIEDEHGGDGNLTANQVETINTVLNYYGDHDAQWLSQLTHMETPWNKARIGIPAGVGCNNVISKESMSMYYGSL